MTKERARLVCRTRTILSTVSGRSSLSRWTSYSNAQCVAYSTPFLCSHLTQDIALDQFSGRTKAPAIAVNPPEPKKKAARVSRQAPVIQHVSHLPKPQLKFKRKADYTNGIPWYPALRHKFNAQVPMGYTFQPASVGEDSDRVLCVASLYF